MRRLRALLQMFGALVALVALVGGVPWALLTFGDWPISGVPTVEQITELPSTIVTDDALFAVLTVVLWISWALFAGSVVAEAAAQFQGRTSAVNFGGPVQRLAGRLVGSLVVSFGSFSSMAGAAMPAMAAPAPQPAVAVDVGGPAAPGSVWSAAAGGAITVDVNAQGQPVPTTTPNQATRLVTVQRGDTSWSLAEQHLGDGLRWREIWELNQHRVQADGETWSNASAQVRPGWELLIPVTAVGADFEQPAPTTTTPASVTTSPTGPGSATDDPAADGTETPSQEAPGAPEADATPPPAPIPPPPGSDVGNVGELVVMKGDNFWDLAESELAEEWGRAPTDAEVAPYWQQMIEDNRDRLLPPEDPDLIYPEQVFSVPAVPVDPTAPPPPPAPPAPPAPPTDGNGSGTGTGSGSGSETPGSETPGEQGSGSETPGEQGSGSEAPPVDESPEESGDTPPADEQPPADETPSEQPPVDETPEQSGETPPADEPPADEEAPADEPPADEETGESESPPIVDEMPGDQPPAEETPGETGETPPVDETPETTETPEAGGETPPSTGQPDQGGAVPPPVTQAPTGQGQGEERPASPDPEPAASTREQDGGFHFGLLHGGVALAGVLLVIERRRRAQQRHRARGQMVAMPPPAMQHPERELRHGADVDGARLLDVALRAAAAASGASGLPPLRWVEASESAVMLILDQPSPPPRGFVSVDSNVWMTAAPFEELSAIAARRDMPTPTLIPLGASSDGTEVLMELEASAVLSVTGPMAQSLGLLRAVAVAASTAPWSEQSRVLLVGMEGELTEMPWVTTVPRLSDALDEAEAHVDRITASLRALRCQTTAQARAAGVGVEASEPLVIVSAVRPSDLGERQRLLALTERPHNGLAVITPANGTPVGRLLSIGDDGRLRVVGVDKDVRPHSLDADDTSVVVALLDVAARHDNVPIAEVFQQMDVRRAPLSVVRDRVSVPDVPPPGAVAVDVEVATAPGAVGSPLPPFAPGDHAAFAPPEVHTGPTPVVSDAEAFAALTDVEPEPVPPPSPEPEPRPVQDDADLLAPFLTEVTLPADEPEAQAEPPVDAPAWPAPTEADAPAPAAWPAPTEAGAPAPAAWADPVTPTEADAPAPAAWADPVTPIPAPPAEPAAWADPVSPPADVPPPPLAATTTWPAPVTPVPPLAPVEPEAPVAPAGPEPVAAVVAMPEPEQIDEEPEPVRGLDALMEEVDVLVRVLGEVQAVRPPRHENDVEAPLLATRQKGLEAIAYLALRESAVDREDLEINLFPDGANASKTVYNTVSSARALVGEQLFPRTEAGRYELSDRVVTDYGLFCDLVAQADETDDVDVAAALLGEALGLVRGEPFTGVGRNYAWVGPHRGMIVAQVVDAAEELAEIRLATGDWRLAEWAARRGLRAFPSDERMYRLLMRAARAAGNVPGVQRVFRELCDVIADPDMGVEPEDTLHPETVQLLEELTRASNRAHRSA